MANANGAGLTVNADNSVIRACTIDGQINGFAACAGGFAAKGLGSIFSNCQAKGEINANYSAGGIIGECSDNTFLACCSTAKVSNSGSFYYAGGLAGRASNSTLKNCYARGAVSGYYAAGLVGLASSANIENCYAAAPLYAESAAGGLISYGGNATVTASYWDMTVSGITGSDGGEGAPTESMTYPYSELCYVGWDFSNVWAADTEGENDGYPLLRDDGTETQAVLDLTKEAHKESFTYTGEVIPYTITLLNIGTAPVQNITVKDDLTGLSEPIAEILPGRQFILETQYTVVEDDLLRGSVENTAEAVGYDPDGNEVTAESTATVQGYIFQQMTLTIEADADTLPGEGAEITYTLAVQNTGSMALTDVSVEDPLTGLIETIDRLDCMVPREFTTRYLVAAQDVAVACVGNTASAKGKDVNGLEVSAQAIHYIFAGTDPGYCGGSGTEADPFLICRTSDWIHLTQTTDDWDKHFALTDDLNFFGALIPSMGKDGSYFSGNLDGRGYSLKNIRLAGGYIALIGSIQDCTIRDLHLENILVDGKYQAAGLAIMATQCTISGCTASGRCTAATYDAAGLVVHCGNSTIINCAVAAEVSGFENAGGIACVFLNGTCRNCFSTGKVNAAQYNAGGLVASAEYADFLECYSTAEVTGDFQAGGLVGSFNNSNMSNCYAQGNVFGGEIGGLIGSTDSWGEYRSTVSNCYAAGQVGSEHESRVRGGIIGIAYSGTDVTASYWDTDRSGIVYSASGEGRINSEMTYPYAGNTFIGWNFDDVWAEDATQRNNGYPWLKRIPPPEAEPDFPPEICLDFNAKPAGFQAGTDEIVPVQDALFRTGAFQLLSGDTITDGLLSAMETDYGLSLHLDNISVGYVFGPAGNLPLCVSIYCKKVKDIVNLSVNGELRVVKDFAELYGTTVGGALIRAFPLKDGRTVLHLAGPVSSFSIGGQALSLEKICSLCNETETAAHPADTDGDNFIDIGEAAAFVQDWQEDSDPMTSAIRAKYIAEKGGAYVFDPALPPPLCWIPESDIDLL